MDKMSITKGCRQLIKGNIETLIVICKMADLLCLGT